MERNRNNPSKFWSEIRTVIPKEIAPTVTTLEDETTGATYTSGELSDHINHYFATIGEKLANLIRNRVVTTREHHPYIAVHNNGKDGVTNTPFRPEELLKVNKHQQILSCKTH